MRSDKRLKDIFLATAFGMTVSITGTPFAIKFFRRKGYGQAIREDGPAGHRQKSGTPTMGGVMIVLGTLVGYSSAHALAMTPPSASAVLVLFLMTGLAVVGFIDDFIKLHRQRNLGLRSGAKLSGQIVVSGIFAVLTVSFPDSYGTTPAATSLSFLRDIGPSLGVVTFSVWVVILVTGYSNAVNLTDGLDGLAGGAACMVLVSYIVIGNWQFRHNCGIRLEPGCYWVRDPFDLTVVAAATLGACFGFLWWNAPPAKIFMGDTGSLPLGGTLAGLAVTTRTQMLLAILGGLFVLVTLSVILQVGARKMTGRRIFRMAPLQHHFELLGWAETTIVVRFWMTSATFVGLGLGIFYIEWIPS